VGSWLAAEQPSFSLRGIRRLAADFGNVRKPDVCGAFSTPRVGLEPATLRCLALAVDVAYCPSPGRRVEGSVGLRPDVRPSRRPIDVASPA
jgi:hypothetical protein